MRGDITERYQKNGRDYVVLQMELTNVATGRLVVRYVDRVILAYRSAEKAA